MSDLATRKLTRSYTVAWICWIVAFGVIEFLAVRRRGPNGEAGGDTLSEHVWKLIGTQAKERTPLVWACRIALVLLFGWLIPHFLTGWLRG